MYVLKSYKEQQYKQEYIDKHGLHFTDNLAQMAIQQLINPLGDYITIAEINKWLLDNNKAVFLLNNSTLGDIFYAANIAYANLFPNILDSKSKCIECVVLTAQSEITYEGQSFIQWIADCDFKDLEIDWKKYI